MYLPSHFSEEDPKVLRSLIETHPLATVVTRQSGGLHADHIPMLLSANSTVLSGHIAKANNLWREADNTEVLVIFQGPDGYVSPNWYPSKKEHGKVVPTWNYCVVHVRGKIHFIDDRSWKLNFLNQLTDQNERKQSTPWSVSDAPEDYTERLLEAIIGLEVCVESMLGKYKLSQNQSPLNYAGVVEGLQQQSAHTDGLVDMMRNKKD
ncbi:FMN-binding negative transcriptional regulator [Marinicella sp. W31]|uniref:FMN-binding negative transcriptional regulator n=1 Tax=Marinicella sp. W31 TaxID=3023713 RepID=UPI003757F48E